MFLEPYRRVLAIPGTKALLLVGVIGRIPIIAVSLTLTLYVVGDLRLGFLSAGLVGAAATAGQAAGAPFAGRFVDRYGIRPVVAVTTCVQLVFWLSAGSLPYEALLAGAFVDGMLMLPVFSIIRQCLAVVVPAEGRRTAFTLDSMLVEVSAMVGPAVAVAATTAIGGSATMALVGMGMTGSGVALFVVDPPTRAGHGSRTDWTAPPRRQWMTPALFALLAVAFAVAFMLTAIQLDIVAAIKADAATRWTGLVIALFGLSSLAGGFAYGALPRALSPLLLTGCMAALTAPVGLVGSWQLLTLALIPAGFLGAPAMTATIDALSQRVPAAARGEAVGLHSTALTLGLAAAGPITGYLIDGWGTHWSLAVTGLSCLLLMMLSLPLWRRSKAVETGVERDRFGSADESSEAIGIS
ncbi:MFS transporter [Actinoallomurus sp. CA-142502]|uniref:MFS transporter n=1 Tax=Actinoallomurus sp. CA-142502 TaxID=3239885 RepID=UPI003D8CA77D